MGVLFKPRRLSVELDHHDGVYYGGQKLQGVVQVELDEPLVITDLELSVFGGSHVEWTGQHSDTSSSGGGGDFQTRESYISDTFVLWGADGHKEEPEELPKGRHLFPFNWSIPGDAPCSFEGDHGWVRYYVRATIKLPGCRDGCHSSIDDQVDFTVLRHLDLNSDKKFASPMSECQEVVLASAFCRPGRVWVSLGVPRMGYVPGEHIHADVDVQNMAARKVKATSLALRRIVRYGTESPHMRVQHQELSRVYGDVVTPGKRHCWSSRSLQIPPSVPSRLDGCNLIDVKYELQLQVDVVTMSLTLTLPIIVGTIPLCDSYLTTWTYREIPLQQRPAKRKALQHSASFATSPTCTDPKLLADPSSPLPSTHLSPKYRFYYTSTPVITKTRDVTPLECSPGLRRRSMFVCRTIRLKSRCEDTLLESVV